MNEKAFRKEDERAETKNYDQFAVGIIKPMDDNIIIVGWRCFD